MITKPKYHVIGLNPSEQLALRFMLRNAYAAWVDKVIAEAKMFDEEERQEKSSYSLKLFERYNEITALLVPSAAAKNPKSTCLILSIEGMSFIRIAAKSFDPKNCYLSQKDIEVVQKVYEPLRQKIEDTSQFTYTRDEIDKAQKE